MKFLRQQKRPANHFKSLSLLTISPRLSEILSSLALSVMLSVSLYGRAGLKKDLGFLRHGPRGPMVLRHQMVHSDEPGACTQYQRWTTAVLLFLNMMFKIIIAYKFGDTRDMT